jgi:two-component system alkaline phosphatase synthesis response regulator PhoP
MKAAMDRVRMKKALLVEDHTDLLEMLSWQMELMGFSVITANNGKEGVKKAMEEVPHLILMNIMMPGLDGLEATRMIRSNPETKDTLIMASTVLYKESELKACIEAGCNDYIVKPFTLQELQEKIQDIIPRAWSI